jgi:hypothetical protein
MEPAIKMRIARGKLRTTLTLLNSSSERKASRIKTLKYAYKGEKKTSSKKLLIIASLSILLLVCVAILSLVFKEEAVTYFSKIFSPETQ